MSANLYAICNNPDTYMGLQLASVSSQMAYSAHELSQALENINSNADVVILNTSLAKENTHILEKYRDSNKGILFITIPDPQRNEDV